VVFAARRRAPWWAFPLTLLAFLGLMVLYEWLRSVVAPDTAEVALRHAAHVADFERSLGLGIEADVQRFFEGFAGGEPVTSWAYTIGHTLGFATFFLWLWFRRRAWFAFIFAWFWIANGIAVLGYLVYPLAPPRLTDFGLSDPTAETLKLGGALDWFQPFRNLYAAMPSMHVGYTVLFALAITWLHTSPWRWLAWLWPAAMLTVVMATANHWWLDGVGGAVAVGIALAITLLVLPRARRPWEPGGPREVPHIRIRPAGGLGHARIRRRAD
jgi:hypothetical protein